MIWRAGEGGRCLGLGLMGVIRFLTCVFVLVQLHLLMRCLDLAVTTPYVSFFISHTLQSTLGSLEELGALFTATVDNQGKETCTISLDIFTGTPNKSIYSYKQCPQGPALVYKYGFVLH